MTTSRRLLLSATATLAVALGGCVMESPYWAQTFPTTASLVPIQTWTIDPTRTIRIECSKAYHGGLYPFGGPETWTLVTTLTPSSSPSYDTLGNTIYSAGTRMALPAACWNADYAYSPTLYMTALRATQTSAGGTTTTYRVFDELGLECLGREDGKARHWFAWLTRNCAMTYSGSTTPVPYVRVIASAQAAALTSSQGAAAAGAQAAVAGAGTGTAGLAANTASFPSASSLALALAEQPVDKVWATSTLTQLRNTVAKQAPEGSQWLDGDCRTSICRIDIWHRDADAQRRFVSAFGPLGLFSHDGSSGWMISASDRSGLRSQFYIAREGTRLPASKAD